jgi:23S rRNA pseudouridine955/2504/2580 synthase
MSAEVRQFTVAADDDGIRLDRWFKRHLPEVSFNTVSRWARTGQLRVDGKRAAPGDRLETGQQLRVPPAEAAAPTTMAAERPRRELSEDEIAFARSLVIHIDPQAIVIAKPPGLATQGGTATTEHVDGLLDALQYDLPSRTSRAAAFFSKAFQGRTARKVYWALVMGAPSPENGLIDAPLAKQPGTGGEKMHVDTAAGQPAKSRYRTVEHAGNRAAWLELQPLTGRTHQLRVHCAAIGHPIVGDGKYGGRDAFLTGGVSRKMHLHARRLVIEHPDGGMLDVSAEPPAHIAESFAMLGFDMASGDLPLDEVKFRDTPEGKQKLAAAEAKARRKARKGERRSRTRAKS